MWFSVAVAVAAPVAAPAAIADAAATATADVVSRGATGRCGCSCSPPTTPTSRVKHNFFSSNFVLKRSIVNSALRASRQYCNNSKLIEAYRAIPSIGSRLKFFFAGQTNRIYRKMDDNASSQRRLFS